MTPCCLAAGAKCSCSDGCSRFFILGLLDVHDPERLATELAELRKSLLADPYFKGVPSMQIDEQKTALFFHAKDDLPEVRREVLKVLARHELHFSAVVKNKRRVLGYVQSRNDSDPAYRYRHDELYDHMLRRLFKQRLHTHDAYRVTFATRGHKDRTEALRLALEAARKRFAEEQGVRAARPLRSSPPPHRKRRDFRPWIISFGRFSAPTNVGKTAISNCSGRNASGSRMLTTPALRRTGPPTQNKSRCWQRLWKASKDIGAIDRNQTLTRHGAEFCPSTSLVKHTPRMAVNSIKRHRDNGRHRSVRC